MAPRQVNRKVTVDFFRHPKTTKIVLPGGRKVRVVGATALAANFAASKLRAKTAKRAIKGGGRIFTSEADRTISAALGMAEAASSLRGKVGANPVKLRKELGEINFFTSSNAEKVFDGVLAKKYNNNEAHALNAWLEGKELFDGAAKHPHVIADGIIRRRVGLAVRVAENKKGIGGKGVKANEIYLGNSTHGWMGCAIFERLTGKSYLTVKSSLQPLEHEKGIRIIVEKKVNSPLKATLTWRNYKGDVSSKLLELLKSKSVTA